MKVAYIQSVGGEAKAERCQRREESKNSVARRQNSPVVNGYPAKSWLTALSWQTPFLYIRIAANRRQRKGGFASQSLPFWFSHGSPWLSPEEAPDINLTVCRYHNWRDGLSELHFSGEQERSLEKRGSNMGSGRLIVQEDGI